MKPPLTKPRRRLDEQPSISHFFGLTTSLKCRLSQASTPARCRQHNTNRRRVTVTNIGGCCEHVLFAPIMTSASVAELGREELICSVCLELLDDPVTLGCGHSFCLECVNRYWAIRGGTTTYICPNCREVFPQKPQLKKNVMIASMVTQMKLGVEEQEKRPRCPDHGKLIQLYCKDDDSLMCFMCMTVKHQQHKVIAVEVAHAEFKDSLSAQSAQVEESKKYLESNLLQLKQKHANGEGSAGDVVAALERKRGKLHELVDETFEVMKKRQVEQERLQRVLLEKHIMEVEKKLKRVQETELSLKEALQEAQAVVFLQDHKDVQCRLDSVRDMQHTLPGVLDFTKEQHELDSLIQLNKTFLEEMQSEWNSFRTRSPLIHSSVCDEQLLPMLLYTCQAPKKKKKNINNKI
uniref:tripartite motif-containing protein 12A-like isoform X1 n=2 Tax=Myxine glutinosa TaxID=7769 RepID=UPI00358FCAE6